MQKQKDGWVFGYVCNCMCDFVCVYCMFVCMCVYVYCVHAIKYATIVCRCVADATELKVHTVP